MNYLKKCVNSLLEIDFPDYEIIVVNDGSTDGTEEFLNGVKNRKIKVVHNERNQGISASRNIGLKHAKHDIIAFTDDDCEVDKDWLRNLTKGFIDEQTGFVIGQTFYDNKNYKGYFPERLVSNIGAKLPMTCNIAYQKKVFTKCGDFDSRLFRDSNEDSEMAIRSISKGFSFNRSLDALVYHQQINWNVKSILKSAKNSSAWPLLKKKYPDYYLRFHPPIKFGLFVAPEDYLYIIASPIFIPLLFVRYIIHGKRNFKVFFAKWPIYLILKRYFIYKEAIKNKVLMF
jgi:glycosyltransferase involved in cell wall biosynthesis